MDHMVAAMRLAIRSDPYAQSIWPGFSPAAQTLIVQRPEGPVVLGGAGPVADGFAPVSGSPQVFARPGAPPDSLTGMNTGMTWGGKKFAATVVPFVSARPESGITGALTRSATEQTLRTLVHEAFHTYQASRAAGGEFVSRGGDVGVDHLNRDVLTLLYLENQWWIAALEARDSAEAGAHVRSALALRQRRCGLLPPAVCRRERSVEHREGAADFVMSATVARLQGTRAGVIHEELRAALLAVNDMQRMARFHYYDRGHVFFRLQERLGDAAWRAVAARIPPDSALALLTRFDVRRADSLARDAERRAPFAAASAWADRLLAAWKARQDSVVRVFWSQRGIPVRVYPRSLPSRSTGDPTATVANVSEGAGQVTYAVGIRESRMWYGRDQVMTVTRGANRIRCCEPFELTAVAPVTGAVATIAGRPVPLDTPSAGSISGTLRLVLPTIEVHSDSAEIAVFRDSISIRLP